MASRSVICRDRRMRQIIDERDTGKSWYFAITEYSNCLTIRSPSLLFHEYLREAFIFTQDRSQKGKKRGLISFTAHEQKIILSQTQFNDIAHEQIIFCWQLFAGHVMGSWQMKRKKNLHRMAKQVALWVMCKLWMTKNKAIIQSGWGEGYQLFLTAHWYFRLILRAKVKCIAAVSSVENFV